MPCCKRKRSHECGWKGCGKTFTQASALASHRLTHTGEKPHACDWEGCGKTFTQASSLVTHGRTHTGEKPHACDWEGCGKTFTQAGALASHGRTHTGEKPHACDWEGCGKAFTEAGALASHRLTHTGEKPHACDWEGCGKTFTQASSLVTHGRTHTGEKPHPCDWEGCGKAFTTSSALATHRLIHTGEKPHACDFPECGAAFTQSSSLARHKQAWHTERGVQRRKKREEAMARALTRAGIHFEREHYVSFQCAGRTWGYLDFVIILEGRIVILEVDEFQHAYSNYSVGCDLSRIMNVVEAWRTDGCTLPVTVIRWNPDGFTVDGAPRKVNVSQRHQRLVSLLHNLDGRPQFEIVYMFYDVACNLPRVLSDPEFEDAMKPFCSEVHH